jgi:hypothetical protein
VILLMVRYSTNNLAQRDRLQDAEARTIFTKAKDIVSVYEFDAITLKEGTKGSEDTDFNFDNDIIDSAASCATFKKQKARHNASEPSSTIQTGQRQKFARPSFDVSPNISTNSSLRNQASTTIAPSSTIRRSKRGSKGNWEFRISWTISKAQESSPMKKDQKLLQEHLCL